MKQHEQLKWICDKIGYEWVKNQYWVYLYSESELFWDVPEQEFQRELDYIDNEWYEASVWEAWNVREIIFTTEFMEKFRKECDCTDQELWIHLLNHLDNPSLFLYNLLQWKQ